MSRVRALPLLLSLAIGLFIWPTPARADFLDITCNGAFIAGIENDAGRPGVWTFNNFACGDSLIRGKFTRVDAGDPSDLPFVGAFIKNIPMGMAVNDSFDAGLDNYHLPDPGPADAWHELHGHMGGLGTGMASIDLAGTLNKVATPKADTGLLANNAVFNVSSFENRAKEIPDPPWTRHATFHWTFDASTPKGGTIHLEEGQGNSFWEAVPEPSSSVMGVTAMLTGIACAGRRRTRSAASR